MSQQAYEKEGVGYIASCAVHAITQAMEVTPRPATSRDDIAPETFILQAEALRVYFEQCALSGIETDDLRLLFLRIRTLGKKAESEAVGQPIRGYGFTLGILCAAAGHTLAHDGIPDAREICGLALSMCRMALRGEMEAAPYRGARGEASNGFPAVQRAALPKFKAYMHLGYDKTAAYARAYLSLIANAEDTAAINAVGAEQWKSAADEAALLSADDQISDEVLKACYDSLNARGFVFDGCAALMAGLIFLCEYAER